MVLFKITFIIFALGSGHRFFESVLISVSMVKTLNGPVSRTLYHKLVTVML